MLPPGRHTLSTQNIPFLNNFINKFTGGDVFISEIFFVKTCRCGASRSAGPSVTCSTRSRCEQVIPRIFGEFSLVVTDPVRFIVGYTGQAAQGDNDQVSDWVKGLFMNGVKTTLGELCEVEGKSVLQAVALDARLSQRRSRERARSSGDRRPHPRRWGSSTSTSPRTDAHRSSQANRGGREGEPRVVKVGISQAEAEAQPKQFELDQKFSQDARTCSTSPATTRTTPPVRR